jgi:L-alanine-DL-glutamate epimerase-like enolase superfamily enzyme
MFKRWLTSVWRKVGGSRQDSISAYSETHGEHEAYEEKNESPDGLDKLRRKGLI